MTSRGEMTDQDLLRAYAESSDMDSLGTFFGRYEESLLRFSGKLLGDSDRAQDVVQETFIQVARQPRKLLGIESCHNWLLRVARNIGITQLRQDARARRHADRVAERVAGRVAGEAAKAEAALSTKAERDETKHRVREVIAKLHPRHRELLMLKIEESKSYKEIAEITGLTATNVGYLLHMAMKDLERRLKPLREDLE